MGSQQERERRLDQLRALVQAGLYKTNLDQLARAIVKAGRKKVLGLLDVKPGC